MATFGYETIGSLGSTLSNYKDASQYTCPEDGTAQSITAALKASSGTWEGHVKCAIYKASDLSSPITNGETEEKTLTLNTTAAWFTFNFPTPPTLEANTDYVLCAWADTGSGSTARMLRDDDASVNRWYVSATYSDTWGDLPASDRTGKFSIYCTYTPSGGGLSIPVAMRHYRNLRTAIASTRKLTFPKIAPLRI